MGYALLLFVLIVSVLVTLGVFIAGHMKKELDWIEPHKEKKQVPQRENGSGRNKVRLEEGGGTLDEIADARKRRADSRLKKTG